MVETIPNTARPKTKWPSHVLSLATSISVHTKKAIVPVSHMQQSRTKSWLSVYSFAFVQMKRRRSLKLEEVDQSKEINHIRFADNLWI